MKKTICDVCGKEIVGLLNRYQLRINSDLDSNNYNYFAEDICEDCTNSIYHYIKGLQKEENK